MSGVFRFTLALLTIAAVLALGVLAFEALELGGGAWFALLLIAMIAGSLFDRERFYGPRKAR